MGAYLKLKRMNYIKSFLHRLFFILLIVPFGLFLILEICIRFFIEIIKWIFIGSFNEDFITDVYTYKLIEFLKFDKY